MKKKLNFDYIAIQSIYFMMMSVMCGYGAYLLLQIGYSSSTTGILMSLGNILCLILQPIAAQISDTSKKLDIFKLTIIISIGSLIASIFGFFQRNVSLLTSISFIMINGIYATLEPLNNAIPDKFKQNGYDVQFGVGRAFGSLSYALISMLMGLLTSKYPYYVILILNIVCSALLIIIFVITKNHYYSLTKIEEHSEKQEVISYTQFFKRHIKFSLLVLALAGIYFGFTISDNLIVLIINNLHGDTKDMGLIMGIKAMLEVPVIFFYDKIEKKFGNKTLLKIAAIFFSIKALLFYLAKSTTLIYIAQFTQPLSLALMIPSLVSCTNEIMDKKEAVRGQALYIMAITLASTASSAIGGSIADNYSVSAMLMIALIVSIISSICFCILVDKNK